jgi:hypothetical protein
MYCQLNNASGSVKRLPAENLAVLNVPPIFCIWGRSEQRAAARYCDAVLTVEEIGRSDIFDEVLFL